VVDGAVEEVERDLDLRAIFRRAIDRGEIPADTMAGIAEDVPAPRQRRGGARGIADGGNPATARTAVPRDILAALLAVAMGIQNAAARRRRRRCRPVRHRVR